MLVRCHKRVRDGGTVKRPHFFIWTSLVSRNSSRITSTEISRGLGSAPYISNSGRLSQCLLDTTQPAWSSLRDKHLHSPPTREISLSAGNSLICWCWSIHLVLIESPPIAHPPKENHLFPSGYSILFTSKKMTPKSLSIFVAVTVSVLTQQAVGQASSATASTTTGSVSSATANPTENAWYIPLAGAGGDSSSPWGANVTTNGNSSPKLIPLVISNGTQTGVSGSSSSSAAVFPNAGSLAGGNNHQSLEVQLEDASNPELVLGLNAALGLSSSSQTVPTVPFGLNLGLAGKWNGSVLFGGDYDANRIYGQSAWQTVPEASNISSTFLATGHLPVASVSVRLFHYQSGQPPNAMGDAYPFGPSIADNNIQTVPAVLNISSESLILPAGDFCGNKYEPHSAE